MRIVFMNYFTGLLKLDLPPILRKEDVRNSASTNVMFIIFNADCFDELFHQIVKIRILFFSEPARGPQNPSFWEFGRRDARPREDASYRPTQGKEYLILILIFFGFLYWDLIFPYYNWIFKLPFHFENKNL